MSADEQGLPDPARFTGNTPASSPGSAPAGGGATGPDLVRAALAQARAAAKAKGLAPGAPRRRARPRASSSGSGPDGRDPVLFGSMIRRVVDERGWAEQTSAARVTADWERLVGPAIAEHCRPASLVDGRLVLVAESSAWATQLSLLTRRMQATLDEQVGQGVVTAISVRGPVQADWRKGPRRVRGRGPRDTYG